MMHSAQGTVRTIATVSSRNASANSAARSGPSSGMRLCFADPGTGGLAKMQTMASGIRTCFLWGHDYGAMPRLAGQKINSLFHGKRPDQNSNRRRVRPIIMDASPCRAGVGAFALLEPAIAPFSFAGVLISFFAGARDGAVFKLSVFRAERK